MPCTIAAIAAVAALSYFVTAHVVAHQEVPANVQGAEFITESVAEYSALMVLKHRYGTPRCGAS